MTGWTRLRVRGDSRQRIGITAGVGALVGVLMVLVGMEPRLVLVGFVVMELFKRLKNLTAARRKR